MKKQTKLRQIGSIVLMTMALLFIADIQAIAQKKDYKPGEKIEWNNYGTWEEATFVEATPDGSQPMIREKPNQFHKDGFLQATQWKSIRPLGAGKSAAVTERKTEETKKHENAAETTTNDFGKGLMTKDQVLGFLQAKIGDKAYADIPRETEIKKQLAEMIKARGLDFRFTSSDTVFWKKLASYGGLSGELNFPLEYNYGEPTKESWLLGAWQLNKIGAAADYVKNDRVYRKGEIGVGNVGTLSLNANGTYVWKSLLNPQPASGKWRKATREEMTSQGGDGIVLLKAQSGEDWIVTHDRRTTLKGDWVEIAQLNSRWIREMGSRVGKK